ncbi:hypothetical protein DBR45_10870 [Pseudomonas sp. HMWF031]|nr:hypothetical protein DBR45_10870 [Pseudomonas sp. HMWF031]
MIFGAITTSLKRRSVFPVEALCIAGIVVWPKADIRYGRLDSTDIENFPPRLKRLLVIYVSMMIITVVWMGVAYLLLKLR